MQESNFNVIIDSENYTTVIGESAKIDVGQAISNVQSGKAEIEAAVQDGKAAFNLNAAAKTQEFDDHVVDSLNEAKQWAIGEPEEPAEGSSKYWAGQATSSVTGLGARVTAIEGKIPADASSSNQLADKSWVGNQGYITGITSGDVTSALGYTPYNSSNPNGYTSNVGTVTSVNNTSPDGSGNVTITIPNPLPSQTGHSGEFLTTDGTDASWGSPDLSGKADVDMSNVTTSGKSLISGLPMPSNRYTDLTLGASGSTYTAPANGWFAVSKTSGATGKYLGLLNATSDIGVETYPNANTNNAKLIIPIKKNDVLRVTYSLTGATNYFKFIYAEGEPNV